MGGVLAPPGAPATRFYGWIWGRPRIYTNSERQRRIGSPITLASADSVMIDGRTLAGMTGSYEVDAFSDIVRLKPNMTASTVTFMGVTTGKVRAFPFMMRRMWPSSRS